MYAKLLSYVVVFENGTEGTISSSESFALAIDNEQPQHVEVVPESTLLDTNFLSTVFSQESSCEFVVSTLAMPNNKHEIVLLARTKGSNGEPLTDVHIIGRQHIHPSTKDYEDLWQPLSKAGHTINPPTYHTEFTFPMPESPDQAEAIMRLIINFHLESQPGSPKKVTLVKGFILNMDSFDPYIDPLTNLIHTLEKGKPGNIFYQPIGIPDEMESINRLMRTCIPEGAEFHIPTDQASMEVVKKFKINIIRMFELHNYYFQHWSALIKPEFLVRGALLPENPHDLINTRSLFYLIMNHGTRGKDSTLHSLDNLTHSMSRIFNIVNFHWIASAQSSGYDHTRIAAADHREKIEDLNAAHIAKLIDDKTDFIERKKPAPNPNSEKTETRGTLLSLPHIQRKILSIVSNNERDWVSLLGYTPPRYPSTPFKSLFSPPTHPASIHYSLIFYFMNTETDTGQLRSPNHPTLAMSELLFILGKQLELRMKKQIPANERSQNIRL